MAGVMRTVGTIIGVVAAVPSPIQPFAIAASLALNVGAGLLQKKPGVLGSPNDIVIGGNNPSPYPMGRTYVGGTMIHDVGYGPTTKDVPNPYRSLFFVGSRVGPIEGYEATLADYGAVAFTGGNAVGYYHDYLYKAEQLGACPEGAALAGPFGAIPGWGASHRLSGCAAWVLTLRDNREGKIWSSGVPRFGRVARWVRVYDARQDSTHAGGAGGCRKLDEATYVGGAAAENPSCHGATYALGRYQNGKKVMGCGIAADAIDWPAWTEWANVCDANGWKIGGVIYEPGNRWDNLKRICEAGAARPAWVGGKLTVIFPRPRVALDTIRAADLTGEGAIDANRTLAGRLNILVPKVRLESHNWEHVQTLPVRAETYIAEDGEERTEENHLELVQQTDQGAELTAYRLVDAREIGPIVLPCKLRMIAYKPGDALNVDLPEEGLANRLCVVTGRRILPGGPGEPPVVELTLETETIAKHEFALGRTSTAPPAPSLTTGADMDQANVIPVEAISGVEPGATRNVNRGAWTAGTAYKKGDLVEYQGSAWAVSADHVAAAGAPPPNANVTLFVAAGEGGAALAITQDKAGFTFAGGALSPAGQVATFTARRDGIAGTVAWATIPPLKTGQGDSFTISAAELGANPQLVVTAALDGHVAAANLLKIADPTTRRPGNYRQVTDPADNEANAVIDGDLWTDISATPMKLKVRIGGTWQIVAGYVTNTDQLEDGAKLGEKAKWAQVGDVPAALKDGRVDGGLNADGTVKQPVPVEKIPVLPEGKVSGLPAIVDRVEAGLDPGGFVLQPLPAQVKIDSDLVTRPGGGGAFAGDLAASAGDNWFLNGTLTDGTAGWTVTNGARTAGVAGDPAPFLFKKSGGTYLQVQSAQLALPPSGAAVFFSAAAKGVAGNVIQIVVTWYGVAGYLSQDAFSFAVADAAFRTYERQLARPAGANRYVAEFAVYENGAPTNAIYLTNFRFAGTQSGATAGATVGANLKDGAGAVLSDGAVLNDRLALLGDNAGTGGRGRLQLISIETGGPEYLDVLQLPDLPWGAVFGAAKPADNADVTALAQIVVQAPPGQKVQAASSGAVAAGTFPRDGGLVGVAKGGASIRADAGTSFAAVFTNGTGSIATSGADKGRISWTGMTGDVATVDVTVTVAGIEQPAVRQELRKERAPAAIGSPPSGGSGTGPLQASDTLDPSIQSMSNVVIAGPVTVRAGAGGAITLRLDASEYYLMGSYGSVQLIAGVYIRAAGSGAFAIVGGEQVGSGSYRNGGGGGGGNIDQFDGGIADISPGSLVYEVQASGLTPGNDYEIQAIGRCSDFYGISVAAGYLQGTAG